MKRLLVLALLIVCLGCSAKDKAPVRDFTLPDLDGNPWTLSNHHDRPVLLSFYATWCKKCQDELVGLQQIAEQFPVHIAVICRDPQDAEKTNERVTTTGLRAPVLADPQVQIFALYDIQDLPTTVLVDQSGREIMRATGGAPSERERISISLKHLSRPKKRW